MSIENKSNKIDYWKPKAREVDRNANELQKLYNETNYWDQEVREVTCISFGDEVIVRMTNDDKTDMVWIFLGCDRTEMQHLWDYPKFAYIRDYTRGQLMYYAQDITINDVEREGKKYYECIMNLYPMYMTVYCLDVKIEYVPKS